MNVQRENRAGRDMEARTGEPEASAALPGQLVPENRKTGSGPKPLPVLLGAISADRVSLPSFVKALQRWGLAAEAVTTATAAQKQDNPDKIASAAAAASTTASAAIVVKASAATATAAQNQDKPNHVEPASSCSTSTSTVTTAVCCCYITHLSSSI